MRDIGVLYLIPVPVAPDAWHTLSAEVLSKAWRLKHFFAEDARTWRRMLRALYPELPIAPIEISEIDKETGPDLGLFAAWMREGFEVGVVSESGCPGVADPGALLVAHAHAIGAVVRPLSGPSSLLLAVMGSGLNGQCFAFQGYLPVKDAARKSKIRQLEQYSAKEHQTQIFIETPYRNNQLMQDLLLHLSGSTHLCVALGLTGPSEWLRTQRVAEWQNSRPNLPKEPCVFLFLAVAH